jgi:tetratricopeptide (TPR) repeat protein
MCTNRAQQAVEYYNDAIGDLEQGKYQFAISKLTEAIYLDSTFLPAFYLKGICLYDLKRYQEAIVDFSYCISKDTTKGTFYLYRSDSYRKMQQLETALQDLDRAGLLTSVAPGIVHPLFADEKQDLYDVITVFDIIIRRGEILMKLERYMDAIVAYTDCLRMGDRTVIKDRAYCLYKLGHKDYACKDIMQAITWGDTTVSALKHSYCD